MIRKSQTVGPRVENISNSPIICLFKGTAGNNIELCVCVWHSIKTLKIISPLNWTKAVSEVLKNVTVSYVQNFLILCRSGKISRNFEMGGRVVE
jgi:FPC/CPF motif-containing protein YcgG